MFWNDFRKNHSDKVAAAFRIVFGFLFLLHGLNKWGVLAGEFTVPGGAMLIAALIETFGGLLVLLGLFTDWAAFISSGMMAVTYWWKHAFSAGATGFWNPVANGGELAALFSFAFLLIWVYGAGKCSIDAKMKG